MNRLVAMESPSSVVARPVASTNSARVRPDRRLDRAFQGLAGELGIRVADEIGGDGLVAVDDRAAVADAALGQRVVGRGHHDVAAQQQIGVAGGDAHGVDVFRPVGDADVGEDRAALLGEAGHVHDGAALALQMRRHAQQRADGDDAGAADAGDQDVERLLERRQLSAPAALRRPARSGAACVSLPPSTVTKLGQKPLRQE